MRWPWFALIALVWFISPPSHADTQPPEYGKQPAPMLAWNLFTTAAKLGGYHDKCLKAKGTDHECVMPEIRIGPLPEHLLGQFVPAHKEYITISEVIKPGTIAWNASVIHEYTHYFQYRFGSLPVYGTMTCDKRFTIEQEAHFVQWLYLDTTPGRVPWSYFEQTLRGRDLMCRQGHPL